MSGDSPLYSYLKTRARNAERHAEQGRCLTRWRHAADLWDTALPHSKESNFIKKLHAAVFMAAFNYWRSHNGRGVIKHGLPSNENATRA